MATIGSTIHLLDIELGHDRGRLLTKIYHDSKIDEYELPNKFEYHTCKLASLFKAALKHAVQCCSNEKDFHDERRHLRLSYLFREFSPIFIDKCITGFYNEFNIETETCFLCPVIPYQILRQHVLENYEQQIALTKQRKQQNEKQNIIRVPYSKEWNRQMAVNIQNDLLSIVRDSLSNKEVFDDIKFELEPRPQTPLTMNDYLVDKRPSLRLLTLGDNEKCKECMYKSQITFFEDESLCSILIDRHV